MDTIRQFYTKRNCTNYTPIKRRKHNESNAYKKGTESNESNAYKKRTDWSVIEVDWTPIEIDWTVLKVDW